MRSSGGSLFGRGVGTLSADMPADTLAGLGR
jgi:hypothetical protein